jgi:hypothetical protein
MGHDLCYEETVRVNRRAKALHLKWIVGGVSDADSASHHNRSRRLHPESRSETAPTRVLVPSRRAKPSAVSRQSNQARKSGERDARASKRAPRPFPRGAVSRRGLILPLRGSPSQTQNHGTFAATTVPEIPPIPVRAGIEPKQNQRFLQRRCGTPAEACNMQIPAPIRRSDSGLGRSPAPLQNQGAQRNSLRGMSPLRPLVKLVPSYRPTPYAAAYARTPTPPTIVKR